MIQNESKRYIQAMLCLDPYHSARQIVDERARYLGLENQPFTNPGADAELPRRRQTAEATLAEIRSDFWSSPVPEIQSRLAALKLEGMPDLAASAARILRAAEVRPEFERLHSERKINTRFISALRRILILPPAAAGQKQEEQERELSRWGTVRSARKTVRFIKKKYPRIYQLEREWFDHIDSPTAFASPARNESSSDYRWIWIVIVVALSILSRLSHLVK
jgi:hypothetical protein